MPPVYHSPQQLQLEVIAVSQPAEPVVRRGT